jgi:hypothetical protein
MKRTVEELGLDVVRLLKPPEGGGEQVDQRRLGVVLGRDLEGERRRSSRPARHEPPSSKERGLRQSRYGLRT